MLWSVSGGRQGGNGKISRVSGALSGSCKHMSDSANLSGSRRGGVGHTSRLATSKASNSLCHAQEEEEGDVVGPQL